MGAIISAPVGLAATCCGSLAGTCCSNMCCKACSFSCLASSKAASITYVSLISTFVMLGLFFRFEGGDIAFGGGYNSTANSVLENIINDPTAATAGSFRSMWNRKYWCAARHPGSWIICCSDVCGGIFSVYRFSWSLCIFFSLMTVLTLGTTKFGAKVHRGYWIAKLFAVIALLVSTLYIDNHTFEGYRETARYMSFAFLLMQILLLIDFAYSWNESWINKDDESDSDSCLGWKAAILGSSAALYVGSFTFWVLMYIWYDDAAAVTVVTVTLVASLLLTAISCSKYAPHGTLLTSAVVTGYATYLCYSALSPNGVASGSSEIVVGLLVAAISMATTAFNAAASKEAILGKSSGDAEAPLDGSGGARSDSLVHGDSAAESGAPAAESWWYFHLMMVACSFYMAMLLTDWSANPATVDGGVPVGGRVGEANSDGSFWVKIASQWICLAMYAWTLLAPYLLREHRDFGIEFDF